MKVLPQVLGLMGGMAVGAFLASDKDGNDGVKTGLTIAGIGAVTTLVAIPGNMPVSRVVGLGFLGMGAMMAAVDGTQVMQDHLKTANTPFNQVARALNG